VRNESRETADVPDYTGVLTARLEVRPPQEPDRATFIALFTNPDFMVWHGALTEAEANSRFDHMLEMIREVPFGKQPMVDRSSGTIIGYTGVDWYEFDSGRGLEFGYRVAPPYRGRGYATEASRALLDKARESFEGEIFAMIHPENKPSLKVCEKLGFAFLRSAVLDGALRNLYRLELGPRGPGKTSAS
jgi:RimJ/RimL family protein N-acetyltransferase